MVTWMRALTVIAALAVAATLTACGSQPVISTGAAGSPSQGTAKNSPAVVGLAAGFSPRTVRVRVGQQFLVTVSPGVQASGIPWPDGCLPGATQSPAPPQTPSPAEPMTAAPPPRDDTPPPHSMGDNESDLPESDCA